MKVYHKILIPLAHFYSGQGKQDTQGQWMRSILHSGTSGDKLAAMTLLVQEAPIYRLKVPTSHLCAQPC